MIGSMHLSEKNQFLERIQNSFDRIMNRLHRKGQERLTIMVIPHNHEKIFSVHINVLMIIFLLGTLAFALLLAGFSYYQKQQVRLEMDQRKDDYGINYKKAYNIYKSAREIQKTNQELRDRIEDIAVLTGILSQNLDGIPSPSSARSRADDLLFQEILGRIDMAPGSNYLPPVYALKTASIQFDDELPVLISVNRFLGDGFGVYTGMPMGRPFRTMAGLRDSSPFGIRVDPVTRARLEFHTGLDTSGASGTPIYATADGRVTRIRYNDSGYGNYVILEHKYGYSSLYAHMSRHALNYGQTVKRGQLVGYMGRTGRVTGDHLHYEVHQGRDRIDPLPFVCSIEFSSIRCRRFYSSQSE